MSAFKWPENEWTEASTGEFGFCFPYLEHITTYKLNAGGMKVVMFHARVISLCKTIQSYLEILACKKKPRIHSCCSWKNHHKTIYFTTVHWHSSITNVFPATNFEKGCNFCIDYKTNCTFKRKYISCKLKHNAYCI